MAFYYNPDVNGVQLAGHGHHHHNKQYSK